MRRLLSSVLVVLGVAAAGAGGPGAAAAVGPGAAVAVGPGAAAAGGPVAVPAGAATGTFTAAPSPSDAPAAGVGGGVQATAEAGRKVCTVTDDRLVELSGMVATKQGFIVVNDSSNTPGNQRVYFLNNKCAVSDNVPFTGNGPRDTEDLAVSPDGRTLWIADTGDNANNKTRRPSIALWSMPVDGSKKPVLNRLRYPDGARDAEALLINGDGTPIIVTKDVGTARLYTPPTALKPGDQNVTELKLAGEVKIPTSSTSNPLGLLGRLIITGAGQPPGGGKAVLRTYADAFEWDVTNGDVLAALKQPPRMTPLPDEPFGEAITYSPDGKSFLTVADRGDQRREVPINILQYEPVTTPPPAAAAPGGPAPAGRGAGPSWFDKLSLQDITYLIGGVGVFGALLVALGIIGIFRARRRPPAAEPKKKAGAGDQKADADNTNGVDGAASSGPTDLVPPPVAAEVKPAAAGAGRPKGAVYGSGSGVYGGRPAGPPAVPQPPPSAPPVAPPPAPPAPAAPASVGSVYGGAAPRVYGGGQYRPAPEPPNGGNGHGPPRNGYVDHGAGVYGRPRSSPAAYPEEPGNGQEPRAVR